MRDESGAIATLTVLLLPALIGLSVLGTEYGASLSRKAEEQRNADLAAYAAALSYNVTQSQTSLKPAAERIALLNGRKASEVNANLITSPRGNGNNAVSAVMDVAQKLYLAPMLGIDHSIPIRAAAIAEVGGKAEACIQALSGSGSQSGVTLSGGAKINAPKCGVASNASVSVPCGTSLTAVTVTYNTSAPSQPCSGISSPTGAAKISKTQTTDLLKSQTGVTTATARISTLKSLASPSAPPPVANRDIEFPYWADPSFTSKLTAMGCTGTMSGATWTVGCTGSNFSFGKIKVGGSLVVKLIEDSPASSVWKIASIENSGTLSFGKGAFQFGKVNCYFGTFSICNTSGTLSFAGPSSFQLSGGFYGNGGSTAIFGTGAGNSFNFGTSSNGYAIYMEGGANIKFAEAGSNAFSMVGNVVTAAGGCADLGVAAQHDISGYLNAAGGVTLGAGVYTIDGYAAFGASYGGNVTCDGASVGIKGSGVTLVLSGKTTAPGNCSGTAFCIAAGYSSVVLTAPSAGTTAKLAIIGPTSSSVSGGASLDQGASGASVSGALYFPNGAFTMSGGASIGSGSGQCLQIVASRVTLGGGTAAASTCVGGTGGSGGTTVVLVQ
ncbi:hypothetical protein IZ6_31430 [Terrihabitans soli]|uniref:Putative Flp pilus-assembly TadG-like N-terminal domain-containing protein n=1 Tax=Terrihabitans soli TaxID=708113 RepID=A0A6S6R0A2_9HYPH|nr:pilus assembly protein TadG-related protein [Terrihabitans soli]BCJ92408.1 hypothetical protein IZ6_31430 [Terrihabitans soli]